MLNYRRQTLGKLSNPAEDTDLHVGRRMLRAAEGAVVAMATSAAEALSEQRRR